MIKAIIIDDENGNITFLKELLKEYCPNVSVLSSFNSATESINFIKNNAVELVFLDVELDKELGFKLLEYFPKPEFQIIFTTAHEKYALSAIKSSCLEYLLKPINFTELISAIEKFEKQKQLIVSQKKIEILLENIGNTNQAFNKIAIPTKDSYVFLNVNDIICCEANIGYTNIYTSKPEKFVSTKNLKEFEELLNSKLFFRCHKSWLVNLNFIKKFNKSDLQLTLSNDMLVDVSVRKKEEFVSLFEKG